MTDDPIGGPDYGDGDFVPNGGQQGFVGSPGWQASQRLLAEQDVAVEDDMAREEVQFNDEERALVQIAKSFKKSGISMSNARALDDLRLGTLEEDEDGVLKGQLASGHGPEAHGGRPGPGGQLHVNMGPVKHIMINML